MRAKLRKLIERRAYAIDFHAFSKVVLKHEIKGGVLYMLRRLRMSTSLSFQVLYYHPPLAKQCPITIQDQ
jgi:hypothetical protein